MKLGLYFRTYFFLFHALPLIYCSLIKPSIISSHEFDPRAIMQTCSEYNNSIKTLVDSKFFFNKFLLLSSPFDLDSTHFKRENYNYFLRFTIIEFIEEQYSIQSSYLNLSEIISKDEITFISARIIDAESQTIFINYCIA